MALKPIEQLTDVELDRLQVILDDIDLAAALERKTNEELARLLLEIDFPIGSPQHALLMEAVTRIAPELDEERLAELE